MFLGLTDGYFDPELTPESIADHLDLVCDTNGFTIPRTIADELMQVVAKIKSVAARSVATRRQRSHMRSTLRCADRSPERSQITCMVALRHAPSTSSNVSR